MNRCQQVSFSKKIAVFNLCTSERIIRKNISVYSFYLSLVLVMSVPVLAGCSSENDRSVSDTASDHYLPDVTEKTIKIGNITDITGPGATGIELVDMALEDAVRYYNEENIIPGVSLQVISWDGQMDTARTIPGYEWLKHKSVDLITTAAPGVAITLRPHVQSDQQVLFTMVGNYEAIEPPGYVYSLGTIPEHEAYTLLHWIAENDWDYQKQGPAKIGGAAWMEPYSAQFIEAMGKYAQVHPDQFEYAGGFLTQFSFDWHKEVEALKNCDYVFPNTLMNTFVEDLRNAGSDAKLIGGSPHTAFMKQLEQGGVWPDVDGMLIIYTGKWWHESGEEIDIFNELLGRYHPNSREDIMNRGSGYMAIGSHIKMLEIVGNAIGDAGIADFSSESLYEAAQSYSKSIDERDAYSFSDTKRYITNEMGILKMDAGRKDLIRDDVNWYPVLSEP